ncbi:MAG: hypothetical protein ACI9S8_002502 [Chlamydiales bacterium]|jgi:hypothetical protein
MSVFLTVWQVIENIFSLHSKEFTWQMTVSLGLLFVALILRQLLRKSLSSLFKENEEREIFRKIAKKTFLPATWFFLHLIFVFISEDRGFPTKRNTY